MAGSFRHFNALIADRIALDFPDREWTRVLDVGAGAGKYQALLHDYPQIDAVEVHEPYIREFNLGSRYRSVFHEDVRTFHGDFNAYDLVILGDVLEHLEVLEARALLARCEGAAVLVAVPYQYEQGATGGNEAQIHRQPDLTHELFMERYPGFDCLARDTQYGLYVRDPKRRWTLGEVPERPSVLISIPTADWRTYIHVTVGLWETQQLHLRHGLAPLGLNIQKGASVERARNSAVAEFLKQPDLTHLLFIDSDMGWPPEAVGILLEHRAQMIGVPYRKKTIQSIDWAFGAKGARWDGRLLQLDGGLGAGMLMISRSCLERMTAAFPELAVNETDGRYSHHTLFQTGELSEDLTFCKRWRDCGGRVWADPTIELCHVGPAEFSGRFVDHMEFADSGAPATEQKEQAA